MTYWEDQELAADIIQALASLTIDDITYEQMSRIARRIHGLSGPQRNVPKRVADILAEELSPLALIIPAANALSTYRNAFWEYDEMRAALILPMPRKEIPPPRVRQMAQEVVEAQRKLREEFTKLTGQGQEAFRRPFKSLDEDVKRIRKAWRI